MSMTLVPSYPNFLPNFLKIFPTTLHVSMRMFSYPPVKHIPYIILFFHKGSKLWYSLHTYLHNLGSRQFYSKVSDLFLTKKTNAWHFHGCNTNTTAILCMLRLGYSKFNIDGHYNQICQCGAIKAEVQIFLECSSTYTSRQMLITNASKILVEESIFSHSELTTLNRTELIKILSLDILNCLKIRPYACFSRRVCFCVGTHPFNITSPSTMFSVCTVLFVYVR